MEVGLVLSGCSVVRFCLAVWLGSLGVGVITSDLVSTSPLAVSIMLGGAALSNGVAAAGGAAFVSSLGLALACNASITASTIEGTSSCVKFSFGWVRVSRVVGPFFLSFRFLALAISTILIVQLICCTGGVFTLLFTWQLLRMRYSNWCLPLRGA